MTRKFPALDAFRLFAAILVVAVHVSPLSSLSPLADFILTRVFARIAVPFFFMTTGFFLFSHPDCDLRKASCALIKKTAKLYLLAMLLYLPLNINNGYFGNSAARLLADLLFDGTFYHLWYLPAVMLGASISVFLYRRLGIGFSLILAALLYAAGLGGDSYFGLVMRIDGVPPYYALLFFLLRYTRNGLFFAPLFLTLGAACRRGRFSLSAALSLTGFLVSLALMTAEGLWLRSIASQRHDSMYVFLVPCMFFLFNLINKFNAKPNKPLRSLATAVYIIHPWVITAVWYASLLLGFTHAMETHSLLFFAAVSVCSLSASIVAVFAAHKLRTPQPSALGRAWVEVDLKALRHNAAELRSMLPEPCELMAVVKADAYGLGAVRISSELERLDVDMFAVATVSEAVALRRAGLKADILILGATHPADAPLLRRYSLIQLVADPAHARALNSSAVGKLRTHLALDTGMRRLGFEYSDIAALSEVFSMKNLSVEALATHLACSDSPEQSDIDYTNIQLGRFAAAYVGLRSLGLDPGQTHVQSSYGIYNYPGFDADFARAGIALYGVMSHNAETFVLPDLIPVMSLKARIAELRTIDPGEPVSYGRTFTATEPILLATVSIGYADGVPRQLSGNGGACLVRGRRAPIVGRVCMDLLMLNVTGIEGVLPGDVVTLIGCDGNEEIRCEDFAESCGTITNDILSRLGSRLPRIYVD